MTMLCMAARQMNRAVMLLRLTTAVTRAMITVLRIEATLLHHSLQVQEIFLQKQMYGLFVC